MASKNKQSNVNNDKRKSMRGNDLLKPMHTGRIGSRSAPTSHLKDAMKNKGKELLPDLLAPAAIPVKKQVFPAFPKLDHPNNPDRFAHVSTNPIVKSRLASRAKEKPTNKLDKKTAYLNDQNHEQLHLKAVKDKIQKRLFALQVEHDSDKAVTEIFDEQTVPYAKARVDDILPAAHGPSDLNIEISCGFYGYTPTFTSTKIFKISLDKFSHPAQLSNSIVNDIDFGKTGREIGISTKHKSIATIGYKVTFAKDYRYMSSQPPGFLHRVGMRYIAIGKKVLIPVIARFALVEADPISGCEKFVQFNHDWLSDNEKKLLVEDKRIAVERQQSSDLATQANVRKRMQAIEEAATRACAKGESTLTKDVDTDSTKENEMTFDLSPLHMEHSNEDPDNHGLNVDFLFHEEDEAMT
ncbi:hypothetical protein LTR05_004154 [Lithohypha guttulata]|uniref:Uncharacterized protein n=1 Tax=Lithohypha guttulata TaxID=1690604 RepID=A0AAN7Y786_9EURO|nr:hypothetical protein LTR05_004154 [Lithohypha guttulata]